jgi:hypothetical protein
MCQLEFVPQHRMWRFVLSAWRLLAPSQTFLQWQCRRRFRKPRQVAAMAPFPCYDHFLRRLMLTLPWRNFPKFPLQARSASWRRFRNHVQNRLRPMTAKNPIQRLMNQCSGRHGATDPVLQLSPKTCMPFSIPIYQEASPQTHESVRAPKRTIRIGRVVVKFQLSRANLYRAISSSSEAVLDPNRLRKSPNCYRRKTNLSQIDADRWSLHALGSSSPSSTNDPRHFANPNSSCRRVQEIGGRVRIRQFPGVTTSLQRHGFNTGTLPRQQDFPLPFLASYYQNIPDGPLELLPGFISLASEYSLDEPPKVPQTALDSSPVLAYGC